MLIALLLPAVQAAREAARRMSCANNVRQLALSVHNFHDSHNRFPAFCDDPIGVQKNWGRASFLVFLLPYFEQSALYSSIPENQTVHASSKQTVGALLCPSDPNSRSRRADDPTWTNYRGSLGDLLGGPHHRAPRSWLSIGSDSKGIESVTDGTSNSIMLIEGLVHDSSEQHYNAGISSNTGGDYRVRMATGLPAYYNQVPNRCLSLKGPNNQFLNPLQATLNGLDDSGHGHNLGTRAWDRYHHTTGIHTLMPPNSPSCHDQWDHAWVSASSMHPGGVSVSMHDCATRFVSETVGTQNLDRACTIPGTWDPPATVSDNNGMFSYGVWAELGAINSTASPSL
jgi:hypothetical protein